MSDEPVFRFVALRQPTEKADGEKKQTHTKIPYSVTSDEPPLAQKLAALPAEERGSRTLRRLGQEFIASDRYVAKLSELELDPTPLIGWVQDNSGKKLADLDLEAFVSATYDGDLSDVIERDTFRESALRLAESVLAHAIADGNRSRSRDDLVLAIKLLYLVHAVGSGEKPFEADGTLGELVARMLVVVTALERRQPERREPKVEPTKRPPEEERFAALRRDLDHVARAHAELVASMARPDAIHAERIEPVREVELSGAEATARVDLLEARLERLAMRLEAPEAVRETSRPEAPAVEGGETPLAAAVFAARPVGPAGNAGIAQPKAKLALAPTALDSLSRDTRAVLDKLNVDPSASDPFATVNLLETKMAELSQQLPVTSATRRMISFGGVTLDARSFAAAYGAQGPMLDWSSLPEDQPCRLAAGIGDLLIVRQTLKAYQLADFAHVENVLRGESRGREHRRLSLREEITTTEEERETEKERDLQSTERNEMQNEATKTVETQFGLQAGLQVSGSYGPTVSFAASVNASFSTSTSETQRKATSYSREVTEKTAERIRERVREERVRRVLEQIEELNTHRIDNTENPQGHVRGIYRWLNKLYDAQVFNYGQRMMYEFVVPEPAAYFLYALVSNPPQELELEKPDPPMYYSMPLKPDNLTRTNYQQYLAQYDVTTAKPPPPSFTHVTFFEKQEGKEESNYERATKVTVPDGYEATNATTWYWYVYSNNRVSFKFGIGGIDGSGGVTFSTPRRGEVSVGIFSMYTMAFVATADIYCRLTTEGFAKWQHETFAAILEAYLNKKSAYDEARRQRDIQEGVKILGRNPLENLHLERDELKKLSIMTLMRTSYLDIDSYYSSAEPAMDIAAACRNGSVIRFFENAFEWNNMTYVHHPYFWGRHARWVDALHLTDPDPEFAAFLKAGATRIQVPVRPGFERAVAYFCQFGIIWEGNDVPLIGDSLYVPIVQEITENLGKIEDGVPYPPGSQPWQVTVPTDLVVLQDLSEIPGIVDVLTGNQIDLGG
jgi:hypothetical protein